MQLSDDAVIIKGLIQGNEEAFDAMFRKYYKLLTANAYRALGNMDERKMWSRISLQN